MTVVERGVLPDEARAEPRTTGAHGAIDAFGLLPGHSGILVRDDYGCNACSRDGAAPRAPVTNATTSEWYKRSRTSQRWQARTYDSSKVVRGRPEHFHPPAGKAGSSRRTVNGEGGRADFQASFSYSQVVTSPTYTPLPIGSCRRTSVTCTLPGARQVTRISTDDAASTTHSLLGITLLILSEFSPLGPGPGSTVRDPDRHVKTCRWGVWAPRIAPVMSSAPDTASSSAAPYQGVGAEVVQWSLSALLIPSFPAAVPTRNVHRCSSYGLLLSMAPPSANATSSGLPSPSTSTKATDLHDDTPLHTSTTACLWWVKTPRPTSTATPQSTHSVLEGMSATTDRPSEWIALATIAV